VWCDHDGDTLYDSGEGLEGVAVLLLDDLDCDQEAGDLLTTVETGTEGYYTFTDLNTGPPGATDEVCYVVAADASDEDLGTCTLPLSAITLGLTLTADAFLNDAMDFGFRDDSGLPGPFRSLCPLVTNGG